MWLLKRIKSWFGKKPKPHIPIRYFPYDEIKTGYLGIIISASKVSHSYSVYCSSTQRRSGSPFIETSLTKKKLCDVYQFLYGRQFGTRGKDGDTNADIIGGLSICTYVDDQSGTFIVDVPHSMNGSLYSIIHRGDALTNRVISRHIRD